MADDDDEFDEDDFADPGGDDGSSEGEGAAAAGGGGGDDDNSIGISVRSIREWMTAKRGWLLILGLAVAQGVGAVIMIHLRSEARPVAEIRTAAVRDMAIDTLGHEVKINQIYQLIPLRGGRRMTIGLDIVLILGQLPEERIEGAPRPDGEEYALFAATISSMESSVRSMVNIMLQQIPPEELNSISAQNTIKAKVREYINDTLDRLDFGEGLRPGIGKRRVTDVLLPMYVAQYM